MSHFKFSRPQKGDMKQVPHSGLTYVCVCIYIYVCVPFRLSIGGSVGLSVCLYKCITNVMHAVLAFVIFTRVECFIFCGRINHSTVTHCLSIHTIHLLICSFSIIYLHLSAEPVTLLDDCTVAHRVWQSRTLQASCRTQLRCVALRITFCDQ
jgi:hypothetical protein